MKLSEQQGGIFNTKRAAACLGFACGAYLICVPFPEEKIFTDFMPIPGATPMMAPTFLRQKDEKRAANNIPTTFSPPLLFDLTVSRNDRAESLVADLQDAILRIEGIYDPTRVGMFGPALRMSVRPGMASMNNVFGDRWTIAAPNPNLHYRVRYLAEAWLWPRGGSCSLYFHIRAASSATLLLDSTSATDCESIKAVDDWQQMPIASWEPDLPIFCAPYPGSRLGPKDWQKETAFVRSAAMIALSFLRPDNRRTANRNTMRRP